MNDSNNNSERNQNQRANSNLSSGQQTPVNRRFQHQSISHRRTYLSSQQSQLNTDGRITPNNPMGIISENESIFGENRYYESDALFGTNIKVDDVERQLRDFILNFKVSEGDMEVENQPMISIYKEKLRQLGETEQTLLNIDGGHIYMYSKKLYQQLIYFPPDIISMFDKVVNKINEEMFLEADFMQDSENHQQSDNLIEISIFNLRQCSKMRELEPSDIHKLIAIKGIVIRCSEIYPEMKQALFRCTQCGFNQRIELEYGRVQEPNDCSSCHSKFSFELLHNQCSFIDKQYIKMQETPETVPDGETPQSITLMCMGPFVDSVKPGDRIEVVGIYRANGSRINQSRRTLRSIFKTYLDVISFEKSTKERYTNDENQDVIVFSDEIKSKLFDLSNDEKIYDKLVSSFAPSIFENEDVKKGVLCQLFGGTQKDFAHSGKGRLRAEINVLMIGDPSTAKSQMLQYVYKIAPRGIYTSGKGSSAVGLTAYVSKDPETKEFILESGALVLSDKGICCIDEFDKMDDNTRSMLHEAMEQQTISIAKAGIVCSLNARTSILASANPVDSRYNPKLSVIQNIKLPPSLLSRFDLIYLMLDKGNEVHDKMLANHILSLYSLEYQINQTESAINRQTLTQYVSFARQHIHPIITDEAQKELIDGYAEMRRMGQNKNIITATPRQLESLIRLSEALAKMRLSDFVNENDVQEAIRLIRVATQSAATDPTTGCIDMDVIQTGISMESRQRTKQIVEFIIEYIEPNKESMKIGISYNDLKEIIKGKLSLDGMGRTDILKDDEFVEALNMLYNEQNIKLDGNPKKPTRIRLGNN